MMDPNACCAMLVAYLGSPDPMPEDERIGLSEVAASLRVWLSRDGFLPIRIQAMGLDRIAAIRLCRALEFYCTLSPSVRSDMQGPALEGGE